MVTHEGREIVMQEEPDPFPAPSRGGSLAMNHAAATAAGFQDPRSGDTWPSLRQYQSKGDFFAWLLQTTGDVWQGVHLGFKVGSLAAWLLQLSGSTFLGRVFQLERTYLERDRLVLSGFALDEAGSPLRLYNLQFIGETALDHFGAGRTSLEGMYAAFLDTGDSYTAYAYHPESGTVWRLIEQRTLPNQTDLVFRLVTRRTVLGDGIFLHGV